MLPSRSKRPPLSAVVPRSTPTTTSAAIDRLSEREQELSEGLATLEHRLDRQRAADDTVGAHLDGGPGLRRVADTDAERDRRLQSQPTEHADDGGIVGQDDGFDACRTGVRLQHDVAAAQVDCRLHVLELRVVIEEVDELDA